MEKNIEKKDLTDFPFEDVKTSRWVLSMIVLVFGFIYVSTGIILLPKILQNAYFVCFLFLAFCFLSLFILDKRFFKKIFKPVTLKDILIILGIIVISYIIATLISMGKKDLVKNPITTAINEKTIFKIILLSAFQLIGEEILFVVPFLFIYNKVKKISNKTIALLLAWVLSSLFFGMLHLETYSFNFFQAFIVIGAIRMGISLSYILTKNLSVSYITHFLYDTFILVGVFLAQQHISI